MLESLDMSYLAAGSDFSYLEAASKHGHTANQDRQEMETPKKEQTKNKQTLCNSYHRKKKALCEAPSSAMSACCVRSSRECDLGPWFLK